MPTVLTPAHPHSLPPSRLNSSSKTIHAPSPISNLIPQPNTCSTLPPTLLLNQGGVRRRIMLRERGYPSSHRNNICMLWCSIVVGKSKDTLRCCFVCCSAPVMYLMMLGFGPLPRGPILGT